MMLSRHILVEVGALSASVLVASPRTTFQHGPDWIESSAFRASCLLSIIQRNDALQYTLAWSDRFLAADNSGFSKY
jgi:hypothetical protein